MTTDEIDNIVAFERPPGRSDGTEKASASANGNVEPGGVICFPDSRVAATLIKFSEPKSTKLASIIAAKRILGGGSPNDRSAKFTRGQVGAIQRAASDRLAIERGENEGMTVVPE